MTIVSVSLNEKILHDMDALQDELGYSGRSEVIRDALRMLLADKEEKEKLCGTIDATLLVIHDDKHTDEATELRHAYSKLIKTQIHNHLEGSGKCLEIFVLHGNARRIVELHNKFQANKKIDVARLFVT